MDKFEHWFEKNIELEDGEFPRRYVAKESWKAGKRACRKEVAKILKSIKNQIMDEDFEVVQEAFKNAL